jgi:urease accessory protein
VDTGSLVAAAGNAGPMSAGGLSAGRVNAGRVNAGRVNAGRVNAALLLALLDSRAPAGGHGHSGGMEAAVTAGFVTGLADVEQFCRLRLLTAGQAAAAFAAAAAQLWAAGAGSGGGSGDGSGGGSGGRSARWAELDGELSARVPSAATRAASRQLGSGLRRLLAAMVPSADLRAPWREIARPAPHHPLVLGAAVAIAGGDPQLAATAAALGTCTAAASAAVRLLGLDPYGAQAVLAGLAGEINATAAAQAAGDLGDFAGLPALGTPALDLLADVHARSEVRLFAS